MNNMYHRDRLKQSLKCTWPEYGRQTRQKSLIISGKTKKTAMNLLTAALTQVTWTRQTRFLAVNTFVVPKRN